MSAPPVEVVRLEALAAAPYNPREMPAAEARKLEESVRRFGMVEPLVVNRRTMTIVGGHQRAAAAAAVGLEEVPAVMVDVDEASERALNVALNRIGGRWDEAGLSEVLRGLQEAGADVSLAGFDAWELDRLLAEVSEAGAGGSAEEGRRCPRCGGEEVGPWE